MPAAAVAVLRALRIADRTMRYGEFAAAIAHRAFLLNGGRLEHADRHVIEGLPR